jgi:hypothetical protein
MDVVHIVYDELMDYFTTLPSKTDYLFYRPVPNRKTGKITYKKLGDFKRAWLSILSKNNITNCRWHDLRHHSLTELFNNPEFTVRHAMVIGGWKQRSTIEIYHNIDAKRTATELNKLLLKKPEAKNQKDNTTEND